MSHAGYASLDGNEHESNPLTSPVFKFFAKKRNRFLVFGFWGLFAICGLIWGLKFISVTSLEINPSPGCPAQLAQADFDAHFPPAAQAIVLVIEAKHGTGSLITATPGKPITTYTCRKDFDKFTSAFTTRIATNGVLKDCKIATVGFCNQANSTRSFLKAKLFSSPEGEANDSISLLEITASSDCNAEQFAQEVQKLTDDLLGDLPDLYAAPTGQPCLLDAVQTGVDSTMALSTMTFPLALLLVTLVVGNLRMAICILFGIAGSVTSSFTIMYPVALATPVTSMAPPLMIAVSLAMSIDYSLFLTSRFGAEIKRGCSVELATATMMATSGRIVVVSGLTLTVCFLTMMILPSDFITTMGVGASIAVFMAILANLSLTPSLFLQFPKFFSSFRFYGCTCDGVTCCEKSAPKRIRKPVLNVDSRDMIPPELLARQKDFRHSWYYPVARATQRYGIFILIAIFAAAYPVAIHVLDLKISEGETDLMPRSTPPTEALDKLIINFGAQSVFGTQVIHVPPADMLITDETWLNGTCQMLQYVANQTQRPARMFSGVMILDGHCIPPPLVILALDFPFFKAAEDLCALAGSGLCIPECVKLLHNSTLNSTVVITACTDACVVLNDVVKSGNVSVCDAVAQGYYEQITTLARNFVSHDRKGALVDINISVVSGDPFSSETQDWIKRFREVVDDYQRSPHHYEHIGSVGLLGQGPIQLDTANAVFARFPLMIGVTFGVVFVLLGVAFKTPVVPIRAIVCLTLMLTFTYGLAVMTYQLGSLDAAGIASMSKDSSGSMNWMPPMISFSVMVGLGLDYDVFLMESIAEERKTGLSDTEAVMSGLCQTANVISVAGVVMLVAFVALLISATPALNEIAFLLLIGIIVDCFVTTKFIIPSAMGLLGSVNFWPQKFTVTRSMFAQNEPDLNPVPVGCRLFCCGRYRYEQFASDA